jgi:hypothetical protein
MTTAKQKAANRVNAQRSTGPRTRQGKAVVRLNAITHGLRAQDHVIFGEHRTDFETLQEEVMRALAPVGVLEKFFANSIVGDIWRLNRITRAETALYTGRVINKTMTMKNSERLKFEKFVDPWALTTLPTQTVILDEKAHAKVSASVALLEKELLGADVAGGGMFDGDSDKLDAIARYRTANQRSLSRNLTELHLVQSRRCAKARD